MTPLVFLPGALGRSSFWRPVAERLADLGPVHLLAWPGFGDAPPEPGVGSLEDLFPWLLPRLPPGASHVVAQSMGGVLAVRLAIEHPDRVARLALAATSGGVDVARHGATDWRTGYLAAEPRVPRWFVDDRTDLTERLSAIRAPTLLLCGDADPLSPPSVGTFLRRHIPGARLEIVPGGGHGFATERPDEVAKLLRGHLSGTAPAEPLGAENG
jgi:pimeloyl-ACP methyl ester carboxylesterase